MTAKKILIRTLCVVLCAIATLVFIAATAWGILQWRGYNVVVGRCLVTDGGDYLLIEQETPIILGGNKAQYSKLTTGDRILVIYNFVEESYPAYTAPMYCMRLSHGTQEDLPAGVRETLTELGWYAEPTAAVPADVRVQCIRTDGYQEGFKGPQTAVIRSEEELNEYIEEKRWIWNLESQAFRYAVWEYDEEYFKTGQLVMILQQEPSGSIGHNVSSVTVEGTTLHVNLERLVPENGTDDMAAWHILLETAEDFENVEVHLTEENSTEENSTESEKNYRVVCVERPNMSIVLPLPEDWGYSEQPYDEKIGIFGIWIFPEEYPEQKIDIAFHTKGFGVCGTGLSVRRYALGGRAVEEGTYDGHPMWDYISFADSQYHLVVINDNVDFPAKYQEELMNILEKILFAY